MLQTRFLFLLLLTSFLAGAQEYQYNYGFFSNSAMKGSYFFSDVKASGKSTIHNINSKLPINDRIFHSPGNSLMLQYKNGNEGKWHASIWHQTKRGMDHFKKAAYLSFWIYSTTDIASASLPVVGLAKGDNITNTIALPEIKAHEWKHVQIPFTSFKMATAFKMEDITAVVFTRSGKTDDTERSLYIDDVEFLEAKDFPKPASSPVISSAKGYAMHVDLTWDKITDKNVSLVKIYRSQEGQDPTPVGIQQSYINRYADFIGETDKRYSYSISFVNNNFEETELSPIVEAGTRQLSDEELLTMVQEASFRYYWEGAEQTSGLAKENISGRHNMIATGASGFGIMALIVGTERGFISKEQSIERFIKIVDFLQKADRFHGTYPHFLDGPTGKTEPFFGKRDNGADLVETSFLLQGLLAAQQYFSGNTEKEKYISGKIEDIWKKVEWNWFRKTSNSKFLYWHWSPDQAWVINHNLIGWNETMVTYLLAIASPTFSVPASMYYSGWANQDSTGIKYRSAWGQSVEGSKYTNGNTYFGIKLDVGVNNGGPLFFTHYSYMGYDPHFITDKYTNYFTNNQNIAKINHSYSVKNPKNYKGYGDNDWGLTASDGPFDYSADEPVERQDHGKIAPTGAISSFPYTPDESMKALKNYYFNYGSFLWGEYGFKDAFDLTNNWCSEIYMGLNQAPMTVMIENYRTGLIWKLFMKNPDVQNGLKKLALEK